MIQTQIRIQVEDDLDILHWDIGFQSRQIPGVCSRSTWGFDGHGIDSWSGPLSGWARFGLQVIWQGQTIVPMPCH
jgi:hypothetical protein